MTPNVFGCVEQLMRAVLAEVAGELALVSWQQGRLNLADELS